MKKNITHLVVAAFIILFSSCQKNSNEEIATDKVKTYTEEINSPTYSTVNTFNIAYDASDRIISVTSASEPGNKFVFSYSADDDYSMDIYNSGSVGIHEEFYFNGNSLLDSTMQYNTEEDTTTEKYLYNVAKQLAQMNEYYYSGNERGLENYTRYTYNSIGNMIKSIDRDGNIETFEYYNDLVYAMPVIFPFFNNNLLKKTNLIKNHTLTSNGTEMGSADLVYTFDSNNRIKTIVETASDNTVVTKTFTYF